METEDLKGKLISLVRMNQEKDLIVFESPSGRVAYDVYGNCCSTSWIEHIEGIDNLLGQVITDVIEIDIPETEDVSEYEVITKYGLRLLTAKGFFEMEYRNKSNGYYGGCLRRIEDFNESSSVKGLKIIKEDF